MRISLSFALILALTAAAQLIACRRDADEARPAPPVAQTPSTDATGAGTTASDTHTSADTPPAAPTPPPAPGVSLALVAAIDEHEIAAAEQARRKKVTGAVLEYADLLHREHEENLAQLRVLTQGTGAVELQSTAEVHALQTKAAEELASLDGKSGADYRTAYVEAMVNGHTDALALLETRLIPAAQDERLRNFLVNTRDHVAMHLDRAKELQAGK